MAATSGAAHLLVICCAGVGFGAALFAVCKWAAGRVGCAANGWRSSSLPLPPTEKGYLPFVGVALSLFKDVNGYLADRRRHYGQSPFRFRLLGRMWTMVTTKEDMKLVISAAEADLSMLMAFESLIGSMLPREFGFFTNRTAFFQSSMRNPSMRSYVACWHELLCKELTTTLWGEAGRVELFGTCMQMVLRLNLRNLLGPLILEGGRYEAFLQAFEDIDLEKRLVDVLGSLLSPSKKRDAWRSVKALTSELITHYEDKVGKEDRGSGGSGCGEECTLHWLVRSAAKEGRRVSVQEACGHVFAFTFASLTNTYAVLAWCIIELLPRPELRQRLERELNAQGDPATLEFYDALPVTKALIHEVIRMHTPGILFRQVLSEGGAELSTGHRVPKGEMLGFAIQQVNLDPSLYADPHHFDIDRFLEPRNEHKKAGRMFLVWGNGRHPCQGTRFASIVIAMVLRALLNAYDFAPLEKPVQVNRSQPATTDKPTGPVYISFRGKGEKKECWGEAEWALPTAA